MPTSIPTPASVPGSVEPWGSLLALPGAPLLLSMVAVGVGVVLWLAGGKIIRPLGAMVGAVLGVLLGSGAIAGILSAHLELPASTGIALLLGGLIGAVAGLLAYRLVCAGLTGACVALLVLLATVCGVTPEPDAASPEPTTSRVRTVALASAAVQGEETGAPLEANATSITLETLSNASVLARRIVPASGLARWDSLASSQRSGITLVAIVAGLLAAFAGLVAPARSAAFSASILGSGLALLGIAWLTQRTALDAGLTPVPWLIAWGLLAALGAIIQSGSTGAATAKA